MNTVLQPADWDFSDLSGDELVPALIWEARRECTDFDEIDKTTRAWIDGMLSNRRQRTLKDKCVSQRGGAFPLPSQADLARTQATLGWDEFIPFHDFKWLREWRGRHRIREYDLWLQRQIKPLIQNRNSPWLRLPTNERRRMCDIYRRNSVANVVKIAPWSEAISHYKRKRPDDGLPLNFCFSDYSCTLLQINWSHSKKQILGALASLLNQIEPENLSAIKKWDRRGRKNRDLIVMLERFAIMRLLHHYTHSQVKLQLPAAWKLYGNRKWYDERRQALKDFRALVGCRDSDFFPRSWVTKSSRSRSAQQLPRKQVPLSQAPER